MIRKILYSVSLWFYGLVGRFVRWVKVEQPKLENEKRWATNNVDYYEPKRKFRWTLIK